MGNCFGSSSGASDIDPVNVSILIQQLYWDSLTFLSLFQEERRRQMAEAAEKRLKQDEGRGMKDVEGYKKKLEQREKAEEQAKISSQSQGAPLKVCVNS